MFNPIPEHLQDYHLDFVQRGPDAITPELLRQVDTVSAAFKAIRSNTTRKNITGCAAAPFVVSTIVTNVLNFLDTFSFDTLVPFILTSFLAGVLFLSLSMAFMGRVSNNQEKLFLAEEKINVLLELGHDELPENDFVHLLGLVGQRPIQNRPEAGINVHALGRDYRTGRALELLWNKTGSLNQQKISEEVQDFRRNMERFSFRTEVNKKNVELALFDQGENQHFPPLLGNHCGPAFPEYQGDEVIARLWMYSKTHSEANLCFEGMVQALSRSIQEDGHRVCNTGKVQQLVVGALQGRLDGVNVDNIPIPALSSESSSSASAASEPPAMLDSNVALGLFFADPARQGIASKKELLEAAEMFLLGAENVDRASLIKGLNEYAALEEIGE